jgi:hypothetical protein
MSRLILHGRLRHGKKTEAEKAAVAGSSDQILLSSEKCVKCDACYRQFDTEERLTAHKRKVHTAELFTCQAGCGYTTKKRKLMQLHVKRSHLTEKSGTEGGNAHVCHICQRTYRTADSYRAHIKSHSEPPLGGNGVAAGSPLFRCAVPDCDFGAKYQSDLDRHAVKHSGDKGLVCGQCGFACKRKSELIRHQRIKHSDMPEKACRLCTYSTRNMDHLKRHVRLKHEKCSSASTTSREKSAKYFDCEADTVNPPRASLSSLSREQLVTGYGVSAAGHVVGAGAGRTLSGSQQMAASGGGSSAIPAGAVTLTEVPDYAVELVVL